MTFRCDYFEAALLPQTCIYNLKLLLVDSHFYSLLKVYDFIWRTETKRLVGVGNHTLMYSVVFVLSNKCFVNCYASVWNYEVIPSILLTVFSITWVLVDSWSLDYVLDSSRNYQFILPNSVLLHLLITVFVLKSLTIETVK